MDRNCTEHLALAAGFGVGTGLRLGLAVAAWAVLLLGASLAAAAQEKAPPLVLFDFEKGTDQTAAATDAKVSLVQGKTGLALRVQTGHAQSWPGITLKAPEGKWDLSAYQYVALDVVNLGEKAVEVCCRVDNPGADGQKNCLTDRTRLEAGASGTLTVQLSQMDVRLSPPVKLFGMRGYPAGAGEIDPANIVQLIIFVPQPKDDHDFTVDNIRAGGTVRTVDSRTFLPFIDEFGQYIHKDWPGKVHSLAELRARREQEAADLQKHPGPPGWGTYGGWTGDGTGEPAPRLEATGFFHAARHQGKWWLVDPEGRLFWSHGVDCITPTQGATPITDRKEYFKDLPDPSGEFAPFYGRSDWAPHGYYQGKSYETFGFLGANLLRKYGPLWAGEWSAIAHRRLRSWGMNTIANWSDPAIYLQRKTPYAATIHTSSRVIEGSSGYWGKFPDPFAEEFRQALARRMEQERDKTAGDPWCIGYFVHNELSWGDETSLALGALASPPDQPAKRAFLEALRAKYGLIEKLNAAWGTRHASWDDLLASRQPPDKAKARDDLVAFYSQTAEQYFRICRQEVKRIAPSQLYLGCRFAWRCEPAIRAAARFCDVISFNLYDVGVEKFALPKGLDMPVIVGEFHFGALDRGMFHPGLRKTASQDERAKAYESYVRGALRNPLFVGTHWFQYTDQAATGRGDGENYQIGLVDICDTPYPETIAACRRVGYEMYQYRLKAK